MAQAKSLTEAEIQLVLKHLKTKKLGARDRAMFLISCWSGMRVKEIASLTMGDVVNQDGSIKAEIRLTPEQTKGRFSRIVFFPEKLRWELNAFLCRFPVKNIAAPLFVTSFGRAFTANTLCQHFYWMYRQCGIDGASSHSGRRTFITSLASKGISVRVLASLAGHRSIQVTQSYIDVNDDMKRRAVELI